MRCVGSVFVAKVSGLPNLSSLSSFLWEVHGLANIPGGGLSSFRPSESKNKHVINCPLLMGVLQCHVRPGNVLTGLRARGPRRRHEALRTGGGLRVFPLGGRQGVHRLRCGGRGGGVPRVRRQDRREQHRDDLARVRQPGFFPPASLSSLD